MEKDKVFNEMPKMQKEKDGRYDVAPIVAHSRSYQQPVSEAIEQTKFALEQRKIRCG